MSFKKLCIIFIGAIITLHNSEAVAPKTQYLQNTYSPAANEAKVIPVWHHWHHHYWGGPVIVEEDPVFVEPYEPPYVVEEERLTFDERAVHCRNHPHRDGCQRFCKFNPGACYP